MNEQMLADANRLKELAKAFKIETPEQYATACQGLQNVKSFQKKVCEEMDPHIRRAHEAHKGLTESKKTYLAPALEAEEILKNAMAGFLEYQERQKALAGEEISHGIEAKSLAYTCSEPLQYPQKIAGISTQKRFTFEITDKTQIATKFLVPDEVLIRKTVNALGLEAGPVIGKGIVIKEVTTIRAGAK